MPKRSYTSSKGAALGPYAKKSRVSQPLKSAITKASRQAVLRLSEKKQFITQIDEQSVSTIVQGADWSHITNLTTTSSTRTGKEIMLQSVRCRGVLHNNASGNNLVRMVVGYVEDEVAPSNIYQLFQSSNGTVNNVAFGAAEVAGLNSMYQPLNPSKFTVLYDRVFALGAVSTDVKQIQPYDFKLNLKNAKIKFQGNAQGAGNQNRMLYIGAWAAEGADDAGIGTAVEWSGMAHLKYIDF